MLGWLRKARGLLAMLWHRRESRSWFMEAGSLCGPAADARDCRPRDRHGNSRARSELMLDVVVNVTFDRYPSYAADRPIWLHP